MHQQQLQRSFTAEPAPSIAPSELVWPLPSINGCRPSIVRTPAPPRRVADLAYKRAHDQHLAATFPAHTPNGSDTHFMPNYVPAFAVHDGAIIFAGDLGFGHSIILDHGNGWATFYGHLEHMFAMPTARRTPRIARVRAGDALGYVGAPQQGAMKCLRFELWRREDGRVFDPVDPTEHMRGWTFLPWRDERFKLTQPTDSAA